MDKEEAIKEYQCPGCVTGPFEECFKPDEIGVGCGSHCPGTAIFGLGKLFLGLPKGFHRLGPDNGLRLTIFKTFADFEASCAPLDKFNIPCWKHKDVHGNTIIRGYRPRINEGFTIIFLCDCMDKIDCLEITREDIDDMD